MRFFELPLAGAFRVELERHADDRGYFARTYCAREFAAAGLEPAVAQASISWNPRRGTLRGMHWQAAPHAEAKLVRCAQGRVHDVVVDLRPGSPTYLRHVAVELSAAEGNALYIPPGLAHGFLTLVDGCQVHYQMSTAHAPEAARGARWNDPAFAIEWPAAVEVLSDRDRTWPDFAPEA